MERTSVPAFDAPRRAHAATTTPAHTSPTHSAPRRPGWQRWQRWGLAPKIGVIVLAVLLIAVVALRVAAPTLIKRAAISAATKNCPACSLAIGDIDLSLLGGSAVVTGVRYRGEPNRRSRLEFDAQRLEIRGWLLTALTGTIHLRSVAATGAHVRLIRDERRPERPYDPTPMLFKLPRMRVDAVEVQGASLTLVLDQRGEGENPSIVLSNINGRTSGVGTREGVGPAFTDMNVTAVLQDTARLTARVRANLLSRRGDGDADLELRELHVRELNGFLAASSGTRAEGEIARARAVVNLRAGVMTGRLTAMYTGLELHFQRTGARSWPRTMASNTLVDLVIENGNSEGASIDGTRESDEPLLSFVWKGITDAATRIVRAGDD